jgi:hypothetical protein
MEGKMNRRATGICLVTILLVLAGALHAGNAFAKDNSLKEQVIGAWSLIAFVSTDRAGKKVPNIEGDNLKGLLILTGNGVLSVQMISELPKLASHNRLKTTAAEDKAIAHGVLSFFGTYTVNEADKIVSLHIERSSFPNQMRAKEAKRLVTLTGDEMRFDNLGRSAGGKNVILWKRIK